MTAGAVTELLRDLVSIDSVNPDLVPGGAGEAEIAGFVAGWLEEAGLEVELQETAPGRPNVVGVARGTGGGRALMLNAHMDTVGVAGMERPHDPRVEDGRLYGRGAYDMKGSLAAIMLAGAAARARELAGDVIVTAVVDEEYASIGTDAIVERWKADAAIVTEPSGLEVCIAHKGFVWLELLTAGRAAHGSRPDLGVDAIARMGHVLTRLEELDGSLRAEPLHPLLGSGSLHASLIEGGQELSSYPERCRLLLERRTVPGESVELVEEQARGLLDGVDGSVRTFFSREPFEVAKEEAIVELVRACAAGVLGSEPAYSTFAAWMDSAILGAAGIPTVVFGPHGEGAHEVVEWVDLDSVARCAEILTAVAEEFCA